MDKERPLSFERKLSPNQRQKLIELLAEFTYAEVREMIALPAPEGFDTEVSIATLSRFYKSHFSEITMFRQDTLFVNASEQVRHAVDRREYYRHVLLVGGAVSIQERFYALMRRPIDSIDDLKKLVFIARQIQQLDLEFNPLEYIARKRLYRSNADTSPASDAPPAPSSP